MSRHIQTANPQNKISNNESANGKLILTHISGMDMVFLVKNNRLISVQKIDFESNSKIGEIYVGKVKNVLKNIQACFVDIGDEQLCYLPLEVNKHVPVPGEEFAVQIVRDAIKTKPPAVSTALEAQSDYFVFKTGTTGIGVSNKISKKRADELRKFFQDQLILSKDSVDPDKLLPDFGLIIRTKCGQEELPYLEKIFQDEYKSFAEIFRKSKYSDCFSCLRQNTSPVLTIVKQFSCTEYDEIITDNVDFYKILSEANISAPVRLYEDNSFSLVNLYGLKAKLENACNTKVWLNSGANLVIEQTECLSTIDVNSAKNAKGKQNEEFILSVNKEAAEEAAAQIRLRNLSGIIIIDFINMKDDNHNQELLKHLKRITALDPVTTKVIDMTPLGLVEITRKKVNMSLLEQLRG